MKILLVKLSSLGDVLHNLPIVWDLRRSHPDAQIDWVVEEAYVSLLEPLRSSDDFRGIDRIIPIALRRWKKGLKKGEFVRSIQEFLEFKKELQQTQYDLVIDTQGLMKSAYVSYLANKVQFARVIGLANQTEYSGYEPLARQFYTQSIQVPFHCHAVDRSRYLAAAADGLSPPNRSDSPPQFYGHSDYVKILNAIQSIPELSMDHLGFDIRQPYVLCFHSTAGVSKRWGFESWVHIGQEFSTRGLQVILPWGNQEEKKISHQLADRIATAIVPGSFSIQNAFYLVAQARLTIGVDTGLTHLAAVLNCPTIELYCDSPRWKTEGYWSSNIVNLGDKGAPPLVEDVSVAIRNLIG